MLRLLLTSIRERGLQGGWGVGHQPNHSADWMDCAVGSRGGEYTNKGKGNIKRLVIVILLWRGVTLIQV